jgi:hypothetical protein
MTRSGRRGGAVALLTADVARDGPKDKVRGAGAVDAAFDKVAGASSLLDTEQCTGHAGPAGCTRAELSW